MDRDQWDEAFERMQRRDNHAMPVGRESKRKAAAKETWRGVRAKKRTARTTTGIRNRRHKRWE